MRPFALLLAAGLLAAAHAAHAQTSPSPEAKPNTPGCGPRVWIEYTDDDPDYFIIRNRSPLGWVLTQLSFDLTASSGNLVFDTDEGGLGVGGASDFFGTSTSGVKLVSSIPATDGGKTMALQFEGFVAEERYSFRIDLDSFHADGGRTWVLPPDVKGARALATFEGPSGQEEKVDAIFDDKAEADSGAGGCV